MEVEIQPPPPPIQQQQQQQVITPIKSPSVSPVATVAAAQLPSQVKVTTNFNFQYDDNGNLGRVDVSKALCYQSQEIANNIMTKKVLVMHQKKTPILISSPTTTSPINGEQSPHESHSQSPPQQQQQLPSHLLHHHQQQQQQHFIDCNNNINLPQQITSPSSAPTSTTVIEAHHIPQPIFAPKTVNGHFHTIHQPPFINWNHPQYQ